MTKKEDKATMSLQKIVIIVGLIGSILTTIISMGKEISGVAKDWIVSDNKVEVAKLHEEIEELNAKLDERDLKQQKLIASLNRELVEIRTEMNNNYVIALAHKFSKPKVATKTADVDDSTGEVKGIQQQQLQQQIVTGAAPMMASKSTFSLGWITGAIGLLGWIIFGAWYFIHKKKNI
jgi:hypothetical protein